ncbi:hypothetical protein [Bombiscardovia coagulans]|uniref:Uncharacterized protein n=1 Tax=Bombiscardovia coagulans TaxID=686666 RepID=A0A261ET29_9BIFI|nr:hypothetical protein [Bombiscardovia coagulans]OZG49816.1 hypothetical protein BOCO_0333 [Bombiscardovia coagulans]
MMTHDYSPVKAIAFNGKIRVMSDYDETFVKEAKKLKGTWSPKDYFTGSSGYWSFDISDQDKVFALIEDVYHFTMDAYSYRTLVDMKDADKSARVGRTVVWSADGKTCADGVTAVDVWSTGSDPCVQKGHRYTLVKGTLYWGGPKPMQDYPDIFDQEIKDDSGRIVGGEAIDEAAISFTKIDRPPYVRRQYRRKPYVTAEERMA